MNRRILPLCFFCLAHSVTVGHAGYEQPAYIDGCQSIDGRFVITAEQTVCGKTVHGPHKWDFTWKDTKTGKTQRFPAQGIQGGQIYAQLFIAPDGETFALWNHITQYWPEKSHMHSHDVLPKREELGEQEYRGLDIHKKRLIIYRRDGSIIKEFAVGEFLKDDEWESTLVVFTRVHWLQEYDDLTYRDICRMQYSFYRVSPDYTVLEFRPIPSRAKRKDPPRVVRVSLIDGRILDENEKLVELKTPVRPFVGPDLPPKNSKPWREGFQPSLDPVRTAGTYKIDSAAEAWPIEEAPKLRPLDHSEVRLIQDGFKKADTPAWLPKQTGKKESPCLLFTDLELEKLYRFTPPSSIEEIRSGASRGKVASDKAFYGTFNGKLATWRPGEEPEVILEAAADGREISLNDIAVTSRGRIYFTTLKDPEKGRLSMVDRQQTRKITVLFDGDDEPTLWNPNGIAVDPDERFLYVGISSYQNRKHSGVYCFPILADGTIDVETGKTQPWAAVRAPDGIAVHRSGDVYFTAGGKVEVFDPYGRRRGQIKIPKGSGTNLCFGGDRGEVLYITTWNALYAVDITP